MPQEEPLPLIAFSVDDFFFSRNDLEVRNTVWSSPQDGHYIPTHLYVSMVSDNLHSMSIGLILLFNPSLWLL